MTRFDLSKLVLVCTFVTTSASFAACKTSNDTSPDPSAKVAKTAKNKPSPSNAAAEDGHMDVRLHPGKDDLHAQLLAESAKAKAQSLAFYAELRADWCGPCVALEKSMSDPRMVDAFRGTYVAHLDIDEWDADSVKGSGLRAAVIPIFYELGDDAKPTGRTIDGGAWGDNVPENMAPPLKAFFHPQSK